MSQNVEVTVPAKVFEDALALPREVRVELAQALLRSVDGEREEAAESDAGWQGELEERAQRISEGTAELTSWSEAKPAILGELRARREARDR